MKPPHCAGSGLQIAASLHLSLDGYLQTGTTLGAGWQPPGVSPCRVSDAVCVFLPSQGLAVTEDAQAGSGQAAWEAPAWLLGTPGCRESGHRECLGKVHHPRRRAPAFWASTRAGEEAVGTENMTACFAWATVTTSPRHMGVTLQRCSPSKLWVRGLPCAMTIEKIHRLGFSAEAGGEMSGFAGNSDPRTLLVSGSHADSNSTSFCREGRN